MDEDRICGRNAVAALFARRADDVLRLLLAEEQVQAAGAFCAEMARMRRPYRTLPPDELARALADFGARERRFGGVVPAADAVRRSA